MTKFHLFSQDSVRLETAPTGGVRKSYINRTYAKLSQSTNIHCYGEDTYYHGIGAVANRTYR